MRKLLLTPALMLGAFFGSAAVAQETPALPDAPSVQIDAKWKVQPSAKIDLSVQKPKDDFNYYRLPPMPPEFADKPGGIVGRAVEFFDQHSVKGDSMFDTALEKDIGGGFSIAAGSVDMRNSTGPQASARQTARIMTGLPDSETRELRRALAGGMPQQKHGGDGVAVAVRFRIGIK